MTVIAFEGPAGCGKTHRLMDELATALRAKPLAQHQRVLALTFMHGSRRRLDARLRHVDGLAGRFEASTLDSFAWRLTQRWRRLAAHLGHAVLGEYEYDATCALAAKLLEQRTVLTWLEMSYPFVLVDEAQDLNTQRSAIIAARAPSGITLIAFDEFQCLNPAQLPIAIETWLRDHCEPTTLKGCHRTDNVELINAARAVRDGRAVDQAGRKFKLIATPGRPTFAATCIANAIAWSGGGSVAILTPSRQGGFANNAVALVCAGPLGRRRNGPYDIKWEGNDKYEAGELWARLRIADGCGVTDALEAMKAHRGSPMIRMLSEWIVRRRSTVGMQIVSAPELRLQLDRTVAQRRRHGSRAEPRLAAMTIAQAKNREFDHVIVLWPYAVRDDAAQKRRLLYNAITRAKRSCTVLVQSMDMLGAPPFT